MKSNSFLIFIILIILLIGGAVVWNYYDTLESETVLVDKENEPAVLRDEHPNCGENQCAVSGMNNTDQAALEKILKIEPRIYDLGTVMYGQVATYTIKLTNVSPTPIQILKLSTSCGCTKAHIAESDKVMGAGQTVEAHISFDPAVHKDDTDVGPLKRVIYINTDNLEAPELEAEFSATVIKE